MKFLSNNIPEAIRIEKPNCISRFILAAADNHVRYQGASGGVVSEIIRYLFSTGVVQTAINYRFDKNELFNPYLVYSYDDYHQVGSIYHDIPITEFLRQNKTAIKGTIVVVCLPCQVLAVRQLLNINKIPHFIISLFCSGQQKKDATWFYLKNKGIDHEKVECFRYRGQGWPSGIKIKLQDGREQCDANVGGAWGKYRIPPFCLKRCLFCGDTFGINADISVGDPWLKKYMETETAGLSLAGTLTLKGDRIINEMVQKGGLCLIEEVNDAVFVSSQQSAVVEKYIRRNTIRLQRFFYRISSTPLYDRFIIKKNLELHVKLYTWFRIIVYNFLRIKFLFCGAVKCKKWQ